MYVDICILVSHTLSFVKRAVESVQDAITVYHKYPQTIPVTFCPILIVNTRNHDFEQEVISYADSIQLPYRITESNGAPGKGHNACLQYFTEVSSSRPDSSRMILLDGDDAFYPHAFVLLLRSWDSDTVFLMVHDQVAVDRRPHRHVTLSPHFFLYTAHGLERNFWEDHTLGNPYVQPLSECRTPARLVLCSPQGAQSLWFDEECSLYDDYLPFIQSVANHVQGSIQMTVIAHPDIYCYHACSEESATLKFMKLFVEQRRVRHTIEPYRTILMKGDSTGDFMNLLQDLPFRPLQLHTDQLWTLPEKTVWVRQRFLQTELDLKIKKATDFQQKGDHVQSLLYWRLLESYGVRVSALYTNIGATMYDHVRSGKSLRYWPEYTKAILHAFYQSWWIQPTSVVLKNLILIEHFQGHDHHVRQLYRYLASSPLKEDPTYQNVWNQLKTLTDQSSGSGVDVRVDADTIRPDWDVVIYTGLSPSFHGAHLDQPVYGSELAAIQLAEALVSQFKLRVLVSCEMGTITDSVSHQGVTYLHHNQLHTLTFRTLIISRFIWILNESWLITRLTDNPTIRLWIWVHDARTHEWSPHGKLPHDSRVLFRNILPRVEKVICVSEWHREWMTYWSGAMSEELWSFRVCPNGLTSVNHAETLPRQQGRFIWASNPNRGLSTLLTLLSHPKWNIILPQWSLHIYFHEMPRDIQSIIDCHPQKRNIHFHGRVHPHTLQTEFNRSDYFLYPLKGHETFCINALEAQRQGCITIVPNSTGLRTSVQRGILVEGEPETDGWKEAVLGILADLEGNPSKKETIRQQASEWASQQTWTHLVVAQEWKDLAH